LIASLQRAADALPGDNHNAEIPRAKPSLAPPPGGKSQGTFWPISQRVLALHCARRKARFGARTYTEPSSRKSSENAAETQGFRQGDAAVTSLLAYKIARIYLVPYIEMAKASIAAVIEVYDYCSVRITNGRPAGGYY
jgi:hypothetical protein